MSMRTTGKRTGAGAALLLAAALGLGSGGSAHAEPAASTAATARMIAASVLRGAADAGALGDRVVRFLAGAHAQGGVDATIRTASTARRSPPAIPSPAMPALARPAGDVFGSVAIAFRRLPAVEKIAPARREMARANALRCADGACTAPRDGLAKAMRGVESASLIGKARKVNAQVNAYVTYRRDAETWGVTDYWATPRETLARRTGDCEDYAILKMALLRDLGVAETDMSLVVLRDESRGVFHAVLSLRTPSGHLILDNLRDEIVSDRELPHYLPLYSVSAGKGFIHGRKAGSSPVQMSSLSFETIAPGEGPAPVTELRPGF